MDCFKRVLEVSDGIGDKKLKLVVLNGFGVVYYVLNL